MGITDMNLDVLELIFRKLKNLEDKISLGQSHPLLGKAFAFHYRNTFQFIRFEFLSVEQWSFILSVCGNTVKELTSRNPSESIPMLRLIRYCSQAEKLDFSMPRACNYNELVELLAQMKFKLKLKEIRMSITDPRDSAEPVIKALRHLPALRKLELHDFVAKEIGHVNSLIGLEILHIHLRCHTHKLDIFNMFAALRKLRQMEICGGIFYRERSAPVWPDLEVLRILNAEIRFNFPYFPNLKSLCINCNSTRAIVLQSGYSEHLEKLCVLRYKRGFTMKEAKVIGTLKSLKELYWQPGDNRSLEYLTYLNQLEKLTLYRSNLITNDGLLKVLRACKRIRVLTIRRCINIQPTFVPAANEVFRENGVLEDNPVKLIMDSWMVYLSTKMLSAASVEVITLECGPYNWRISF